MKHYRKEIDGLRAIAILGVIFYHLEIFVNGKQLLPGGFLGVDIFFVVSGYLITSLLYEEYNKRGKISFINFYFRRAKRLLPALILVIFSTTLLGYFFLFPSEYSYYLKSAFASLFFVSNIFFHFSGQNYGENIISEKPLLHTWSLGIEEQFYIFFPIFLLITLRYFKDIKIFIFLILIFISFIFSIKISSNHSSFNFYFLTSRIWELLIGAIIVIYKKKDLKNFQIINHNFLSLFGITLIIISFFIFNDVNNHPSFFTIMPVFGCFLILLDQNKKNLINRLLSISVLRGLGLISYSLYLWHYPILVFGKINNLTGIENEDIITKILLVFISIALSILTFYFVENIFRKKVKFKIKSFYVTIALIYFVIIFGSHQIKSNQERQFPTITKELKSRTWFESKKFLKPCFQRKKYFCSFNSEGKQSIFLIGDSIMASLQNELKIVLTKNDFNFITMTNAGCDFVKISKKNEDIFCNENIHDERLKKIKNTKNNIIIMHLNYSNKNFENDLTSQKDFVKNMNNLVNLGNKIIIIYPLPQMKVHVSNELSKKIRSNKKNLTRFLEDKKNYISIDYKEFKEETKYIKNILDNLNHKNIFKVNVENIFCNKNLLNKCIAHDNKNLYFVDNNHLSNFSSKKISNELLKIIKSIN
tara:strand:+ start:4080 stop:6017 length:1938 start_codon:yes stop_codon:yes gene_type:complete